MFEQLIESYEREAYASARNHEFIGDCLILSVGTAITLAQNGAPERLMEAYSASALIGTLYCWAAARRKADDSRALHRCLL